MLNRPSKAVVTRVVGIVGALVALSAFLVLSNVPGSVFGQETGVIMYAENGTAPVLTFTSEDPEGMGIHWDVTGVDADDFTISGGVLTFSKPPNFEKPTDRVHTALDRNRDGDNLDTANGVDVAEAEAADNMYQITIRASEMRSSGSTDRALSTETHVTVEVTDKNEDGMVTFNRIQPEVGTLIMATLEDPDGTLTLTGLSGTTDLGWDWYVSKVTNPVADAPNHWAAATGVAATGEGTLTTTYTPTGDTVSLDTDSAVDEGKFLRAVATYTDVLGEPRTAIMVSYNPVRGEVSVTGDSGVTTPDNGSPGFTEGLDYTRTIPENTARGMDVGAPVTAEDPNDDTLTYELDNDRTADAALFAIDKATGQIKVNGTLDFDAEGTLQPPNPKEYMFYVRAIDPSGEEAEVEVTVMVTNANDPPMIMGSAATGENVVPEAPSELRVDEHDSDDRNDPPDGADADFTGAPDMMVTHLLGSMNVFTASDEDTRGQIFWSLRGEDADDFVRSQQGLTGEADEPIAIRFKNAPDYEMPTDANGDNVYKVTLVATDSLGAEDERPLTIFVDNVEEQGKATLSEDQPTIGEMLTAKVEDPDGSIAVITWQWSRDGYGGDTTQGTYDVIKDATTANYTPKEADDGAYLRATATYLDATSDMDIPRTTMVDERVQKGEGANTEAKTPHDGDGVTDPNGVTASPVPDKVYRVMVTSANAVREDPSDLPTPTEPAFLAAPYERAVAENAEVGSIVGKPVQVTDERGIPFGYSLDDTETNDDNYFMIDNNGQIRVKEVVFPDPLSVEVIDSTDAPDKDDPVLNFEGTNTFVLIVTATDSEDDTRSAKARVTVRLVDLNEAPYFGRESRERVANDDGGAKTIEYAEARTNAVVQLAATEPDGDGLSWEVTGDQASRFEIRDVPDIAGDGKDRRELHFKSQPDYENGKGSGTTRNDYMVTVRATETAAVGGGPNKADEVMVLVRVMNSDEPGMVEVKWLQPEVNTPLPATLTDPDGNSGGTFPIAMDTVITDTNIQWQWYRAKNKNPDPDPTFTDDDDDAQTPKTTPDWEAITGDGELGQTTLTYTPQGKTAQAAGAAATDTAIDETWLLLVKAEYTDAQAAGKTAIGVTAYPVRADVHDDRNNSPDFRVSTATRSVPETTAVGDPVGALVEVLTQEDNDILTYEILTETDENAAVHVADAPFFSIDKPTGQIRVRQKLHFESNNDDFNDDGILDDGGYRIVVRATDPSNETDGENNRGEIVVYITATDVNEAPTVSGMAELAVNELDSSKKDTDVTKYVGLGYELDQAGDARVADMDNPNLYTRADVDANDVTTWPEPISGPDGRLFEYSTPADNSIARRLHFKNPPDFENPMDANRDNVYEVSVRVVDTRGAVSTKSVRITVKNVNEAGKLVITPEEPHDGMAVTATLTDPDGVEYITDWKWATSTSRVADFAAATRAPWASTDMYTGKVGEFLWAEVDYRDGSSVENDPVTALDERNDNPESGVIETYKLATTDAQATAVDENLIHNSDLDEEAVADNSVRKDPAGDTEIPPPDPDPIEITMMVKENVPSTGYVGNPIEVPDLDYKVGEKTFSRNMIGGPDGATFVFAEDMDWMEHDYYDDVLAPGTDDASDPIDKRGQLAAAVVTHFDYEAAKNTYIIEVTDPDAEVAVGPVRVTIMVMDVNESPTAPHEQRGGLSVTGRANVVFDEIKADNTTPDLMVGTYRGIGAQAGSVTWSLSGPDMGDFSIGGSTGEVIFMAAPNYEMPMDADTDNRYQITVVANDGTNGATLPVTVMVVNVDEDGTLTLSASATEALTMAPQVGDTITGAVMDPDGGVTGESWQWARTTTPAMMDSWMDIAGETNAAYTVTEGDTGYYLRVMATYTDAVGTDTAMEYSMPTMMVGAEAGDPLFGYDTSGNGRIDKAELAKAVFDYEINRTLEKPALADLVFSYEIGL